MSKAAAAKDLDKTVSYYADDAIVLPPNAPAATTKEQLRVSGKAYYEPGLLELDGDQVEVRGRRSAY